MANAMPWLALSRQGGLAPCRAGWADPRPVAALVLSGPHRVYRLVVAGEDVVREGRLVKADERQIAQEHRRQAERFTQ
jgi:hypothetical protein